MSKLRYASDAPTLSGLHYRGEELLQVMRGDKVSWDVCVDQAIPLSVSMIPRIVNGVRAMSVWGQPLTALRGQAQLADDTGAFIGVLYQRTGYTIYERYGRVTVIAPGDIAVWYSGYEATFAMPEPFKKLCMIVPLGQFQDFVPNAIAYDGLRIEGSSAGGAMLGSWLSVLADDVIESDGESLASSIETTLDVLAATIAARVREPNAFLEEDLLLHVMRFIGRRLDDDIAPAAVAQHFGISVRHLHRLFSKRQLTMSSWRRSRRLAKCRAELADPGNHRTITEIALAWGFSDAAHLSRLFKATFGISPNTY